MRRPPGPPVSILIFSRLQRCRLATLAPKHFSGDWSTLCFLRVRHHYKKGVIEAWAPDQAHSRR
jgi:hypothetical protein